MQAATELTKREVLCRLLETVFSVILLNIYSSVVKKVNTLRHRVAEFQYEHIEYIALTTRYHSFLRGFKGQVALVDHFTRRLKWIDSINTEEYIVGVVSFYCGEACLRKDLSPTLKRFISDGLPGGYYGAIDRLKHVLLGNVLRTTFDFEKRFIKKLDKAFPCFDEIKFGIPLQCGIQFRNAVTEALYSVVKKGEIIPTTVCNELADTICHKIANDTRKVTDFIQISVIIESFLDIAGYLDGLTDVYKEDIELVQGYTYNSEFSKWLPKRIHRAYLAYISVKINLLDKLMAKHGNIDKHVNNLILEFLEETITTISVKNMYKYMYYENNDVIDERVKVFASKKKVKIVDELAPYYAKGIVDTVLCTPNW